ncbi:MAG: site-specific DNA-methyltransferase, partial [Candidatus Moranbacteria bacterium]|nr:site-specific DNA-methyltransferase [Candidatus Moranbacteria bacterium]
MEDINRDFKNWINSVNSFTGGEKAYCKIDENGEVFQPVSMAWPNKQKAPELYFIPLIHPKTNKECPVPVRGWRNPPSKMQELLVKNLIIFGEDENTQPRRKYFLKDNLEENLPSVIYYGGSDDSLLKKLKIPFDNPKSTVISQEHIEIFTDKNDTILDFFSGSATTAHAVMQLNAEDNGSRKFIMIQLPEQTPEGSEARNAGYKTIADIGKERIRRAGDKIKTETGADIDNGFRVFKIDDSNMNDVYRTPDAYDQETLTGFQSNIKSGRTEEDLLFHTILALGLPLSLKISEKIQHGKRVFRVDENALIACFSDDIPEALIEEIAMEKPLKVVFKDSSFKRDDERINVT